MSLEQLPPVGGMVEAHGLWANKGFGQHFLFDLNITRKIAASAGIKGVSVLEIGPGPGGLTRALLMEGALRVVVVEKDRRFLPLLEEIAAVADGRLQILHQDALQTELAAVMGSAAHVVANLPYNISTPILLALYRQRAHIPSMTLMFQREVAERMAAAPGSKIYGRLSVITQALCTVEHLFDIPASAFVPPPKVVSSVVRLVPKMDRLEMQTGRLEGLTAAAFGQRRKMLKSSLRQFTADPLALLTSAGIRPEARAEELSVDDFLRLLKQAS